MVLRISTLIIGLSLVSPTAAEVEYFDQNWNENDRQYYYTTTQGSRLLPYDWFMALEVADGRDSFIGKRVYELGYLPNKNASNNPDLLPVGFVADTDTTGKKHFGLTCAACHTNQITYQGKTYQIDGGPSMADMWGMLTGIGDALNATKNDADKFTRFAGQVLGQHYEAAQAEKLKEELTEFLEYYNQFIEDSRVPHEWGRGRTDAFGMIFNRVTAINLNKPGNNRKPDAPVSFPFLWGTSWHDRVQWNGSAPNTNDIERLGRNVSEVLGVFAHADLKASLLRPFYRTSARRLNQVRIENRLKKLVSPRWEEHFGSIDMAKAAKGEALFEANCIDCHQHVPRGLENEVVEITMTPLSQVGTDDRMAKNVVLRGEVETGPLEGALIPGFAPLPKSMPRHALLSNVGRGALLSPFRDVRVSQADLLGIPFNELDRLVNHQGFYEREIAAFIQELGHKSEVEALQAAKNYSAELRAYSSEMKKAQSGATDASASADRVLAYKARSLDGIWATAPYLHNGSVPNLYELLLPAAERTKRFHVGQIEFDPVKVGFLTNKVEGKTTLFDTTQEGNRNIGHDNPDDYGTFTEEERWQLVEYMKTL